MNSSTNHSGRFRQSSQHSSLQSIPHYTRPYPGHITSSEIGGAPSGVRNTTKGPRYCPPRQTDTFLPALSSQRCLHNPPHPPSNYGYLRGLSTPITPFLTTTLATGPRTPPHHPSAQTLKCSTSVSSSFATDTHPRYDGSVRHPMTLHKERPIVVSTNENFSREPPVGGLRSSSHASSADSTGRAYRRRRRQNAPEPLEILKSYTVFQRKPFRMKRRERILLLDRQWVHILPSSTKTLNNMFDTSKSVSYHIRLLASASVKSEGQSSIVTVGFKKGNDGRLKEYNVKAESPTIAAEIVQALWHLRLQSSKDEREANQRMEY